MPWVDPFEGAGPETGPEQNDTLTADELGRLSVDLMVRADEEPSEDHHVQPVSNERCEVGPYRSEPSTVTIQETVRTLHPENRAAHPGA